MGLAPTKTIVGANPIFMPYTAITKEDRGVSAVFLQWRKDNAE